MKWFGALLILVAMTAVGFEWSKRLATRTQQLRQLARALQMFEAEVMYGHTPLAVVSRKIEFSLKQPLAAIFAEFSSRLERGSIEVDEAWAQSIKYVWPRTSLRQKEQETLLHFGATLGQHGRQEQQKYIQLTLTHLESEEREAREEQQKYEKMAKSLGFLGGLLAIIVMV